MAPVMDGPLEVFAELMGLERWRAKSRDTGRVSEFEDGDAENRGKRKRKITKVDFML